MKRLFSVLALAAALFAPAAAAKNLKNKINLGDFVVKTGVFNVLFAKEVCSCVYLDGLDQQECIARDNLPAILHKAVKITADPAKKTMRSEFIAASTVAIGPAAEAQYINERVGCVLTWVGTPVPETLGAKVGEFVGNKLYPAGSSATLTPDGRASCCYVCQQEFRTKTVLGHAAAGNAACGENVCQRQIMLGKDCNNHESGWLNVAGPACKAQGAKDRYTFYKYSAASFGGFIPRDECAGNAPF